MDSLKVIRQLLDDQDRLKRMLDPSDAFSRIAKENQKFLDLIDKETESFKRIQESIDKSLSPGLNALHKASVSSFSSLTARDSLIKSLSDKEQYWDTIKVTNNAFDRVIKESESQREKFNEILKNISSHALPKIDLLAPKFESILSRQFEYLEKDFDSIIKRIDVHDASQSIDDFFDYAENSTESEITNYFSRLQDPIKVLILWVLDKILLVFILNVASNLYSDSEHLQGILDEYEFSSSREVTQTIKRLPSDINLSEYSDYRVVTDDPLNLRESPSRKGLIIDQLYRGKLVRIIEKERTWSKVEVYSDESENSQIGWVFTRHLARLKR